MITCLFNACKYNGVQKSETPSKKKNILHTFQFDMNNFIANYIISTATFKS